MPYCIRCGVALGEEAGSCPLCKTSVAQELLKKQHEGAIERTHRQAERSGLSRRQYAGLITLCMLIPLSLPLIIDLGISGGISWSFYTICSILLMWFISIQPFLLGKEIILRTVSRGLTAAACFLLAIDFRSYPVTWAGYPAAALITSAVIIGIIRHMRGIHKRIWCICASVFGFLTAADWLQGTAYFPSWSLYLGLPLLMCSAAGFSLTVYFLVKVSGSYRWSSGLLSASLSCIFFGFLVALLEMLLAFTNPGLSPSGWSLFALIPLLILSWFLFYASKHPAVRASLKRRFHL